MPVNATAVVPAGTTVQFLWTDWQSDHPGPIMTYLARCPGSCSTFKADSGKIWVKIQEDGYDANQNPPWASKRLPTVNSTWSATIPKTLQSGEYILRHEILGLQRASEVGRAQFYPACHQITVTNGGSKTLPAGIALPGDYTLDDPGILLEYRDISATNPYTPPARTTTCVDLKQELIVALQAMIDHFHFTSLAKSELFSYGGLRAIITSQSTYSIEDWLQRSGYIQSSWSLERPPPLSDDF
ncbi:glycoside hydrolase family 61 protein [Moniliophthora roreri]|nr:glycoside hydrolase family 61 protein [Moniliophthora roreri]